MTEKNGLYYCDICKDTNPIPKGTGFSFDKINPLSVLHSHQSCYFNKQNEVKGLFDTQEAKQILKQQNINLTTELKNNIIEDNIKFAKDMIEKYRREHK